MKSNKIQTIFWHTFSAFKNVFQITLLNASVFAFVFLHPVEKQQELSIFSANACLPRDLEIELN